MYQVAIIPSIVGFHWEEVYDAYRVYKEQGWQTIFFTVDGTQPVADPNSIKHNPLLSFVGLGVRSSFSPESSLGQELTKKLQEARPIVQLNVNEFDAIYIPGGHGCLFDVNTNATVHKKILDAFNNNKIVSAVCHGSSCFAFVMQDGKSIVAGKKIIGMLDSQDELLKRLGLIHKKFLPLPYQNEKKIKEAGAEINAFDAVLGYLNPAYCVVDLPFVTGIGPKAAERVAEKVINFVQDKTMPR